MDSPFPGLTAYEVAQRIARGESNRVRQAEAAAYLEIVARNLFTLFNALVFPAAVALFLLREWGDALAVSGMAFSNLFLGLIQEIRAKRHLDRLTLLSEARVRVRREGQTREIASGDVVREDVLLLSAGEAIVADGPVLESRYLEVDEALLTGESDPMPRRPGDALLSGSFCVAGEGAYRAERVGLDSFAQRTAREARSYRYRASPIQNGINRLLVLLSATAIVLCLGYVALHALGDVSRRDLWKMIAATITSMVPQGLVVMTTFAFVLGAVRLSRRGALVQRLSAVETMASIDTLCMDKTGTLTTNRLQLESIISLDPALSDEGIRERLRSFASASLDRSNKTLLALRHALGEAKTELLDQLPFKSQNRYSAVRVGHAGSECVLVLGAAEALQPYFDPAHKCTFPSLDPGLRWLLFAEAIHPPSSRFPASLDGFVLRPLALVGLRDELRPEARQVLEQLAEQGMRFFVLSGDRAETVRATVAPLALNATAPALRALAENAVVSGVDFDTSELPRELVRTYCVFGRMTPKQKVQIVAALRQQGHRVAMIGDGVNDVLPIKTADLGIALGEGTTAAKTVAGIVLETNDFALLPQTLDEGRTIVRNLSRAGKLFLVKNAFTLVLVVGALGVLGLPFPYLPLQVTLLNFLTIGLPALFIMLDRNRTSSSSADAFLREIVGFALRTGVVIGLSGLLLAWLSHRVRHDSEATQRTLLLSLLVVLGWTTLLRVVTDGAAESTRALLRFGELVAASAATYLVVLYVPPLNSLFLLTPLSLQDWGWVLTFATVAGLILVLLDRR